ncbi:hypothetical protein ELH97_26825 (plasmid) [Rhizobium leguminosarum]|nr:hypothetical protein ELI05_27075 [Rhizobium leguminosarum]TAX88034.1 hypothetical protein ELH97_26825 [Rhizobium leguminosarum]TAY83458.1 hypothetical protein ELH83_24240 [Rhizobium leguminosarum]TAY91344.1 hypothetical protein ELH79_27160 [Rhizobium leguminosarum]TAZ04809.1 hypothetical protein ELH78_28880 [Rhizobium leguminosarum]
MASRSRRTTNHSQRCFTNAGCQRRVFPTCLCTPFLGKRSNIQANERCPPPLKHVAQSAQRFCDNDMRENRDLKREERI